MKLTKTEIPTKSDIKPRISRLNQTWAVDWNEIKSFSDEVADTIHWETNEVQLTGGATTHTINFEDDFLNDQYRVIGGAIVVFEKLEEGGDTIINEKPIKNIVRFVDRVRFETFEPAHNLFCDYFLIERI